MFDRVQNEWVGELSGESGDFSLLLESAQSCTPTISIDHRLVLGVASPRTKHHLSPNRTWQSQDNHALLTFLRPLLTSLLLHPTPELSPNQRSPDLLMRQRMLHLPPTTRCSTKTVRAM